MACIRTYSMGLAIARACIAGIESAGRAVYFVVKWRLVVLSFHQRLEAR